MAKSKITQITPYNGGWGRFRSAIFDQYLTISQSFSETVQDRDTLAMEG